MISFSSFLKEYKKTYPRDLHLTHELRYTSIKYRILKNVLTYIKNTRKSNYIIADIGGGYGYDDILIKKILHKQHPNITIDVDVIDPTIDFYNKVHNLSRSDIHHQNEINYIQESLLTMNLDQYKEKYDIIICSEVIEHLLSHEKEVFFTHFNKILKPGGLITLTCPNGSSILKQIIGLYTRKQKKYDLFNAEFHHRYSHIGVPTIFDVIGLFVRKGFTLHSIHPSSPLSSTRTNLITIFLNTLFGLFKYINLFFSTTNIYVAIKDSEYNVNQWYNQELSAFTS